MYGINWGRLVLSAIVAGAVIFLIEGAAASASMAEWARAMQEHSLTMPVGARGMLGGAVISLLMGFGLMFFDVAARSRFGPGWKTALIVALVFFFTGYFAGLIGYGMIGLYPTELLTRWAVTGLFETIVATIAGAWLYREAGPFQARR